MKMLSFLRKYQKTETVKQMEISPIYYAGRWVWTLIRWFFLICIAFLILYPLLYMLSIAFRSANDFRDMTVIWLPKTPTLWPFSTAFNKFGLLDALKNTALISTISTALQIFITCMTGYGFARFRFKGNAFLFSFVILSIIVPAQMLSMPNYLLFGRLDFFGLYELISGNPSPINFLDTPFAFYIPAILGQGLRSGVFVLVFRQFFTGMPAELEEAALIDGCGHRKTFLRIMLPNAVTPIVVYALFSIVWYWSDYYNSYIYLSNTKTLPTLLTGLAGRFQHVLPRAQQFVYYTVPIEQAACLLSIVPLLILFIFGQRWFVQGIERTGMVG